MKKRPSSQEARRLLYNVEFCRSVDNRVHAASALVENLPATIADVVILLERAPHRLSREVQFSLLNMLDVSDLDSNHIERLLPTVTSLLYRIDSPTAILPTILGCMLGGGWYVAATNAQRRRLEQLLTDAVRRASSVHARASALHGMEHALNTATLKAGTRLLDVVLEVARSDRAYSLRLSAFFILGDGSWWGSGGRPELHAYAKKLGSRLEYPPGRVAPRNQPRSGGIR